MKKHELRSELAKLGLATDGVKAELEERLKTYVADLSHRLGESKKEKRKRETERDELIIENLECPVCRDYITPPIYQCDSGTSFCSTFLCIASYALL